MPLDSDPTTIEVIVHGPRCPSWPDPHTPDEWLALQLVWEQVEHVTYGRCPSCGEDVYFVADNGTIDFGI